MAFMETKSCCCGCDLRTGTTIMVVIIAILTGLCFCWSATSSSTDIYGNKDSSSGAIMIDVAILVCCAMAGYSMKKNQRMFLIPFMLIIIGIFVVMLISSLVILLLFLGVSSAMNTITNSLPTVMNEAFTQDGSHKTSKADFMANIGPVTILLFIICVVNIAIFLHFVKVVCSLFAEMGKPNGTILPQMAASPMSTPYYPTVSPY